MKYLVVIALVALLLVLLYRRLRPYLKKAREFLITIRQIQKSITTPPSQRTGAPEKLLQCVRCGTWVPATRALTSRSGEGSYCSTKCLNGQVRRSRKS